MNALLNDLYTAAVPILIAGFGTILTIIMERAAKVARERWGIEIEATHREALGSLYTRKNTSNSMQETSK